MNQLIDNNKLVSVIVTTKNSAMTLNSCLISVQNQTYKNIELIVVDNSSKDDTLKIAKKFTRFVFNKGPERSEQRNFAVSKAKGKYLYIIDADFVLLPHVIEECVQKMASGYDAVVVHNSPDISISWIARVRKFETDMYKFDLTHSAARFFKREVFSSIKGYNSKVTAGEDYDIQNRLSKKGFKTGFINSEAIHLGEPKSFWKHMYKYYEYGKDFVNYRKFNISESKKQLAFLRPVYLRNWKSFFQHPCMGILFCLYHFMKFSFGGAGYLVGKIQEKSHDSNI